MPTADSTFEALVDSAREYEREMSNERPRERYIEDQVTRTQETPHGRNLDSTTVFAANGFFRLVSHSAKILFG